MSAAKKMIEGRAWKARMNPREPSFPGAMASLPKRNCVPWYPLSMIPIVKSFRKRKTLVPKGTRKTKNAKRICRPIPQIKTLMLIDRLCREISARNPKKTSIPKHEIRLYTFMLCS